MSPPPASNQRRKPCSEPRLGALVLQRARQQLVDRIGGLAAQPFQQALATAFRAEYAWRRNRTAWCSRRARARRRGARVRRRTASLRLRDRAARATAGRSGSRPAEQRFLVEPDQRRFQEACEVEIVLRQQHEARQRQQVLDRQVRSPRSSRSTPATSMLLALQRSHQRDDEGVAPAHQHHEVAGMQQLAGARAPLVADQALGMQRDHPGQPLVRRRQRARVGIEIGRVGLAPRRHAPAATARPRPAGRCGSAGASRRPRRRGLAPRRPRRTPSRRRRARPPSSGTRR